MIKGSSARDNSIVTALSAYCARVQRLREIKTNVLSRRICMAREFALRADE